MPYTLADYEAVKRLLITGVSSAGYGDKRTEFRSIEDLRMILNDIENELGIGSKGIRQVRFMTPADKGL